MTGITGRQFARFQFDDLDEAFTEWLRELLPTWTETSLRDPLRALGRALSYLGHQEAGRLDLVASELAWTSLQRRASAVVWARLLGQALSADSPAAVDVLLDLVGTPGPADVVIPDLARFRTEGDVDLPSVRYEHQDGDVAVGNLEFTLVAWNAFTGWGAPAVATLANPWGAGANLNEAVYVGHRVLQWDRANVVLGGTPSDYTAVWEYYDGYYRAVQPDDGTVALAGAGLTMDVDGLLGTTGASHAGLIVRVTSLLTGGSEDVAITEAGGVHTAATATALGQAVPSVAAADYTVSAAWLPWGTATATPIGAPVTYNLNVDLPQDSGHRWTRTTIAGVTAYWVRLRVSEEGAIPVAPAPVTAVPAALTTWTLMSENALQGETVEDALGTTDGTAWQRLDLNEVPYVEGSLTYLDVGGDLDWTPVEEILTSTADDKVFLLVEQPDETRSVIFGDGTTGMIPPGAAAVTGTYRIAADEDGNCAAGGVTAVDAATAYLTNVRNPRAAYGWRERDGATPEDLDRLRYTVPAAFRAQARAVTPDDAATLAVREFRTADGRAPFARAIAIEAGAGPKTVRLVLVGEGGTVPVAADLAELEEYFNGTTTGVQRHAGVAMANQRVVPVAYTPLSVAVTLAADVARRYAVEAQALLEGAVRAIVTPLASDGEGGYRWTVAQDVTSGALLAFLGAQGVRGVLDLTVVGVPALPITLGASELPVLGALTVTVTEV